MLFNPLSWNRTQVIRLPVNTLSVEVLDYMGIPLHSVLYENYDLNSTYTLAFSVTVPACGYTVVFLVPSPSPRPYTSFSLLSFDLPLVATKGNMSLTGIVSSASGLLTSTIFVFFFFLIYICVFLFFPPLLMS